MRAWLERLVTRRKPLLEALPLGDSGREIPWHTSRAEAKRLLTAEGALSLEVNGNPTARLRFGDRTLRAALEFEAGHQVKGAWLPPVPGAVLRLPDGKAPLPTPYLRAATLHFPERDPRGNWRWTLGRLGKPDTRTPDGSWEWRGERSVVRYFEAGKDAEVERLRLETLPTARLLEIVNRSSYELFRTLAVSVDFPGAKWETAEEPPTMGVLTRLLWYVPAGERMTVSARYEDQTVEGVVYARARQAVITPDGAGGLRVVS